MNNKNIGLLIISAVVGCFAPFSLAMEKEKQAKKTRLPKTSLKKQVQKIGLTKASVGMSKEIKTAQDLFALCQKADLSEVAVKGCFAKYVHAKDENGITPLHYAAQNGFINMVKSLIQDGADIRIKDNRENTLLHYAVSALKDNSEVIRFIIAQYPVSINAINNAGETALHGAVFCSFPINIINVKTLLQSGADVHIADAKKLTPLHYAHRSYEAIKLLVQFGADANIALSSDWTPLFYAVDKGDTEFITLLLKKKIDVNACDVCGNTALHYAALKPTPEVVKLLLDNGFKKVINAKDSMQQSPLYAACRDGKYENVKVLLQYGAEVNIKGTRIFIPQPMSKEEFQKTIHYDFDSYDQKPEVDFFMVDSVIDVRAEFGGTPLLIACFNGRDKKGCNKENYDKIVDLLLANRADPNIKDDNHVTPLHAAAAQGNLAAVKKLYAAGADVNAEIVDTDKMLDKMMNIVSDKVTPLFEAIFHEKTDVVEFLAPLSNVNQQAGSFKVTPLHQAALLGNLDIVKILVNCGAECKSLMWGKHTAAAVARCYDKKDVAVFLTEKLKAVKQVVSGQNNNQQSIVTVPSIYTFLQLNTAFEKDAKPLGIHYRDGKGKIYPISSSVKNKQGLPMVGNHLMNLNYDCCPKMLIANDMGHNFSTDIEKKSGNLAYVFIENNNINEIINGNNKLKLMITIPGSIDKVLSYKGQQKILNSKPGVFEFVVHKNLYETQGICLHRFFNAENGKVGAEGFGSKYRNKEQKTITNNLINHNG